MQFIAKCVNLCGFDLPWLDLPWLDLPGGPSVDAPALLLIPPSLGRACSYYLLAYNNNIQSIQFSLSLPMIGTPITCQVEIDDELEL